MDRFASFATFVQVADTGSFSAAARKLNLSPAAVGKQIATLEKWLGARLFDRTTRHLRRTDAGNDFYGRCTRILAELEGAQRAASAAQAEPRGILRVSAPVSFSALYLGPALSKFLMAHAHVSVDLQLDDSRLQLVENGFDCAVRVGEVTETNVIARRVGSSNFVLCAAPAYLKRRGEPKRPQQLLDHDCLRYTLGMSRWQFTSPEGKDESVDVSGRLRSNNGMVLAAAAVDGFGITYAPEFVVASALQSNQLVRLLTRYETASLPIYVVHAPGRHVPTKVRKFIDFVARRVSELRDGSD
ncbi:MAG TPA: LysR family transcriptional regulator [Steroidobacter sp.]|uniref:LysR family transcriptional regulator n=1 Tax=Steroidobacter sp. TaxID=1978227 RepID=UPI002ED88CDC